MVPSRAESLPYGAVVLERLLLAGDIKDVVISAYGLREGLLYARLPEEERGKDPLVEYLDCSLGLKDSGKTLKEKQDAFSAMAKDFVSLPTSR